MNKNKLDEIFTPDVIQYLKTHKEEITEELLDNLRSYGNKGKQIALDILDLETDGEKYYLDYYGNRVSFDGNRRLKKAYTKLPLSPIHKTEIKKCVENIHYFKDNYVKIRTQYGINFPDLREYQNNFLEILAKNDNENVIGLMGRQSGKTITTSIYLSHAFTFKENLNIGIVANKGAMAREFLANVKNIIIDLPIWMQQGIITWNKSEIENEAKMRILTDVPSSDAFRGFTISILVVDECAAIRPSIWEEFSDSIFPSQSGLAWKKNIILSTAKGLNHFYHLVKGAREKTNGYVLFEVDWRDVPRYDSDGSLLSPEKFMKKIVDKHGIVHFNQNYANEFLGSSHTLISHQKLSEMKPEEMQELIDGKLRVYRYPEKNHKYIMSIDPAKDGSDAFAVQIVDITNFKFTQVACSQLQIDYLLMPEYINEWANYYNNPYLIIENNEGAGQSIADQMWQIYEYENLHFDKDVGRNKRKKYPGFRTTTKKRKQILQTLKLFIENDKLEILDGSTIEEFYRFVLVNGKYQADEGAHDDMIMSLAMVFAPFCDIKNFEDMKTLVDKLYKTDRLKKNDQIGFSDLLIIGSFDDFSDEMFSEENEPEQLIIDNSFFGF